MHAPNQFEAAELRYAEACRSLSQLVEMLEQSASDWERELGEALRRAPERVKLVNLPAHTGIGMEAFHNPVASFDVKNWPRAAEAADLINALTLTRLSYERAHSLLPPATRPPMKKPEDLIES